MSAPDAPAPQAALKCVYCGSAGRTDSERFPHHLTDTQCMAALRVERDSLQAQLTQTAARLATAEARVVELENREASCCPEDVGFAEYIGVLEKRLAAAEARVKEWAHDADVAEVEIETMRSNLCHQCARNAERAVSKALAEEFPDEFGDAALHRPAPATGGA